MRNRLFDFFCAALLIAGTVLFLNGGRQHPPINDSLGPAGSDVFYQNFALHIGHDRAWWRSIHGQVLAGPILWALGCVGLRHRLRSAGEDDWSSFAMTALLMGTVCWVVVFIFDGFAATAIVQGIEEAKTPAEVRLLVSDLRANQLIVIKTALASWVLIGGAMTAFGISVALSRAGRAARVIVGVFGVLVGLFPLYAWASGIFVDGPFTSSAWRPNALAAGLWFVIAGATLLAKRPLVQAVA